MMQGGIGLKGMYEEDLWLWLRIEGKIVENI